MKNTFVELAILVKDLEIYKTLPLSQNNKHSQIKKVQIKKSQIYQFLLDNERSNIYKELIKVV